MNVRFDTIRRQAAAAFATLAVSAVFIGAAIGPAVAPVHGAAAPEARRSVA